MSEENVQIPRGASIVLPPLSEKAGRRRTLDERLYVRFPALYRLFAGVLTRLPPRSRFRRSVGAFRLQRAYAAANRRDFDVVLVGMGPETEYEYRPSPDFIAPDQDPVFHGHAGYLRMWGTWLDAFEDLRFEPEQLLDLGDTMLVTAEVRGHGSGSGVAASERVFQLFELRRGLVVKQEDFVDQAKALEAAGLPGQGTSPDSASSAIRIRPTGLNTTRKHRTLDERIFVQFPALYRGFASLWSRLPQRSRLRRQILLRITAQATSAANRRDLDVLLTGFDPQIDFRIVGGPWGMVAPDVIGHHHGHAGYRAVWRQVLEAFEDWALEPEELIDLGHRMFSVTRMSGHGTASGAPVTQSVFQVYTFRHGLVIKQEDFGDRGEALEAAGLSE
jgi:ketosteroid isomerase-like protein